MYISTGPLASKFYGYESFTPAARKYEGCALQLLADAAGAGAAGVAADVAHPGVAPPAGSEFMLAGQFAEADWSFLVAAAGVKAAKIRSDGLKYAEHCTHTGASNCLSRRAKSPCL